MNRLMIMLSCLLLAACSASAPSDADIRTAFEQELPGLVQLQDFELANRRNVGSDESPAWMERITARVAVREATYDIDTVLDGKRILKPVRSAGDSFPVYATVRASRSGDRWEYRFIEDASSKPVVGHPRSDFGPDALIAGSPEAKALQARIAQEKEKARIEEEARLAAEAAERKQKEEAEAAKRKRIEAAVAKYHAAFATPALGKMVDPGTKQYFLVTATFNARDRVWGTDSYDCSSSFAKTVVHAGLLKPDETGVVEVSASPKQQRGGFLGSPRHGVNSENQTSYAYACTVRLLERISN